MKFALTSLDLHFLVKELQALANAKVEKIYQPQADELLFVLHIPGKGKQMLRITFPSLIYVTGYKGDIPESPGGFCLALRKRLANARFREVAQLGFERILRLSFSTKDSLQFLYVELFSPGNLVLCDEDNIVRLAKTSRKWKDRTIRGGIEYQYPKREPDFISATPDGFRQILQKSGRQSIVKTLATVFGLGGKYAEELCARAGIDKAKTIPDDAEAEKLYAESRKMLSLKISARIYGDDITPFPLVTYRGRSSKAADSFCQALGVVLTNSREQEDELARRAGESRESARLMKIIAEQEQTIAKLQAQAQEALETGKAIYENYMVVEEVLRALKTAAGKYSWKEIKEKLKGHRVVREIDEKRRQAVIEL